MKFLRRAVVVVATIVAAVAGTCGAMLAVLLVTARALHMI